MLNHIDILRKEDQKMQEWSGGTTNQLAIYPKDADYSQRNFLWRISSAKVEADESVFTHLPGVWRLIMVLEGEMKLEHERHHSILLKPFEKDSFSGEWTTRSYGKVRDFNVMMKSGCQGTLEAIHLEPGKVLELGNASHKNKDDEANISMAFYCAVGTVNMKIYEEETIILEEGDFLLLDGTDSVDKATIIVMNAGQQDAKIVNVKLQYERVESPQKSS